MNTNVLNGLATLGLIIAGQLIVVLALIILRLGQDIARKQPK